MDYEFLTVAERLKILRDDLHEIEAQHFLAEHRQMTTRGALHLAGGSINLAPSVLANLDAEMVLLQQRHMLTMARINGMMDPVPEVSLEGEPHEHQHDHEHTHGSEPQPATPEAEPVEPDATEMG